MEMDTFKLLLLLFSETEYVRRLHVRLCGPGFNDTQKPPVHGKTRSTIGYGVL